VGLRFAEEVYTFSAEISATTYRGKKAEPLLTLPFIIKTGITTLSMLPLWLLNFFQRHNIQQIKSVFKIALS